MALAWVSPLFGSGRDRVTLDAGVPADAQETLAGVYAARYRPDGRLSSAVMLDAPGVAGASAAAIDPAGNITVAVRNWEPVGDTGAWFPLSVIGGVSRIRVGGLAISEGP